MCSELNNKIRYTSHSSFLYVRASRSWEREQYNMMDKSLAHDTTCVAILKWQGYKKRLGINRKSAINFNRN